MLGLVTSISKDYRFKLADKKKNLLEASMPFAVKHSGQPIFPGHVLLLQQQSDQKIHNVNSKQDLSVYTFTLNSMQVHDLKLKLKVIFKIKENYSYKNTLVREKVRCNKSVKGPDYTAQLSYGM